MPADELELLVRQLLQPLPGNARSGRWLRYEPAWVALSRSREEDDPALPLGEWERPLVKANWKQVAADCARLLNEDSKDFQIAGWLCDAWVRVHQMEGLHAGLTLLDGLADAFWADAWPAIEDGDTDRRVAPFVWLNASLPLTVRLNVSLLAADGQRELPLKMLDWERASTREDGKPDPKSNDAPVLSRQAIRASVRPADGPHLQTTAARAAACGDLLRQLSERLDRQLGQESPSLSQLLATVEAIRMAADSLLQEIAPATEPPAAAASSPAPAATTPAAAVPAGAPSRPPANSGFSDRQHAYQVLAAAASYLESVEPHSPAPYLVRRAVQLGQLSLPEMLRQVSADAGSLDKFFSLLGVAPPR